MAEIIRNVGDIDEDDRRALEHVVGRELRDDDKVIIRVEGNAEAAHPPQNLSPADGLPDWCNVYEGLAADEIEEIEKSILRSPGSRTS